MAFALLVLGIRHISLPTPALAVDLRADLGLVGASTFQFIQQYH